MQINSGKLTIIILFNVCSRLRNGADIGRIWKSLEIDFYRFIYTCLRSKRALRGRATEEAVLVNPVG